MYYMMPIQPRNIFAALAYADDHHFSKHVGRAKTETKLVMEERNKKVVQQWQ